MATTEEKKKYTLRSRFLLTNKIILNDREPREIIVSNEIASRVKRIMNILKGAFFDTNHGRVAYKQMSSSRVYKEYVELTYSLKKLDLSSLKSREEKLAFWINLYNVIVIHGVIELGIRDSVKEVRNFFRLIHYQIGDSLFNPDDIEHGILRGNRHPPNSLFKVFKGRDKRLKYMISQVDPRIHFALVCASSSCPAIEVYHAEDLDKELTIATETFLNSGGLIIDKRKKRILLSRIFNSYSEDFGKTNAERLIFLSHYLHSWEDRGFIEENEEALTIDYQDYDWRLNRY